MPMLVRARTFGVASAVPVCRVLPPASPVVFRVFVTIASLASLARGAVVADKSASTSTSSASLAVRDVRDFVETPTRWRDLPRAAADAADDASEPEAALVNVLPVDISGVAGRDEERLESDI